MKNKMNEEHRKKISEAMKRKWQQKKGIRSSAENAVMAGAAMAGENIVKDIIKQVLALDIPAENKLEMIRQLFGK